MGLENRCRKKGGREGREKKGGSEVRERERGREGGGEKREIDLEGGDR